MSLGGTEAETEETAENTADAAVTADATAAAAEAGAVAGVTATSQLGRSLGVAQMPVSQFSASSAHGNNWNYYGPQFAKLGSRTHYGGWIPQYNRAGEWIQVDLGKVRSVGGFAIQGRAHGSYWVRSAYLMFSVYGGNTWESYSENGHRKMFNCNWDYSTTVRHAFQNSFRARYVRLVVNQFNGWPVLRWELYAPQNERLDGQSLGVATRIPSSAFQASTAHGNNWNYYGPQFARLHSTAHYGGWIPQYNRAGEWIQVDLGKVQEIGAVATQGRAHGSYWVRQYYLSYSVDGSKWTTYGPPNGGRQALRGNDDYWTVSKQELAWPFKARWVRLTVDQFNGWPVLRWELYAPEAATQRLGNRFGISTGGIADGALSASTAHGNNWNYYGPRNARLYHGGSYGGWIPRYNRAGEWVQADLGRVSEVGGVATQGRRGGSYWVTSYYIVYSLDGTNWTYYSLRGDRVLFKGNEGRANQYNAVVKHVFNPPFLARYVRVVVNGFNSWPVLRWELYRPAPVTNRAALLAKLGKPLGVEDGSIKDAQITASSVYPTTGQLCVPKYARLNNKAGAGAWLPRFASSDEYLQVDVGSLTEIGGIYLQGRAAAKHRQFVSALSVTYSTDAKNWTKVVVPGTEELQVFRGSIDATTVRKLPFPIPFKARYVRFYPVAWYGYPAMRLEIFDTKAHQLHLANQEKARLAAIAEQKKKDAAAAAEKKRLAKLAEQARIEALEKQRQAKLAAERDAEHAAAKAKTAAEKAKALALAKAAKDAAAALKAKEEAAKRDLAKRTAELNAHTAATEKKLAAIEASVAEHRQMREEFERAMKKLERLNAQFVEVKRAGTVEIRKRIARMDAFDKLTQETKDLTRQAFQRAKELILIKRDLETRNKQLSAKLKQAQEAAYLAYLNKYNPYRRTGADNWPLPRKRICTCKDGDASQGMAADTADGGIGTIMVV
jgi:coagulation factor V (labile factor)